jgi:hypothetical protein
MIKKVKKLSLSTYNCNVIVAITDELNKHVNSIYKRLKSKDTFDGDAEGILLTLDIDNYYLIFDTKYLSHNTIAHEIYHAVVKVTEDRDIVDEEAQAWLAGYISGEVYKFIYKNEFDIKK